VFFRAFVWITFLSTLLVYSSVLVSPSAVWPSGFLAMLIPFLLVFHLFFVIWFIRKRKKRALFFLAMLLLGWPFLRATFTWSSHAYSDSTNLKVLSYNVRVFNNYEQFRNETYQSSEEMINWAVSHKADIKCFQEFYNSDEKELFNTIERLQSAGWEHHHQKIRATDKSGATFSLNIFSKLPMIKKGVIYSSQGEFQNAIYADVFWNEDTIRVYNLHLQSMHIDENDIVDSENLKKSYKMTGWRMRKGFERRAVQTDHIVDHIEKSPHPVILCGDLNELPYSYTYYVLRRHLGNSFEAAGKGFGFTYSGKLFFLRIDNQFFSDSLKAEEYHVRRDMSESDHYPIDVVYTAKP
jgi:endonuclease/exonuclease/phosphatase family metal-dependent hydrolase